MTPGTRRWRGTVYPDAAICRTRDGGDGTGARASSAGPSNFRSLRPPAWTTASVSPVVSPRPLILLLALVLLAAGCGGGNKGSSPAQRQPVVGKRSDDSDAAKSLGFPGFATKNTTRVGGADPIADAAGVARAVYPGGTRANRPPAVAMADARDWRSATAAAALMGAPVRAPLLLS